MGARDDHAQVNIDFCGDSGDQYTLTAVRANGVVHFDCTCTASVNGLLCKHRLDILAGKYDRLQNSPADQVKILKEILQAQTLQDLYCKYLEEEKAIKKEQEALKKRYNALKRQFARVLACQ